jgi:hypothetical protein
MRDDKTMFLFVFRDEYLTGPGAWHERDRKQVLAQVFADVGWECPQVLAAMCNVGDIYVDRVSQILRRSCQSDSNEPLDEGPHRARRRCRSVRVAARRRRDRAGDGRSLRPCGDATSLRWKHDQALRLLRIPFIANYFIGRDLRDDLRLPRVAL